MLRRRAGPAFPTGRTGPWGRASNTSNQRSFDTVIAADLEKLRRPGLRLRSCGSGTTSGLRGRSGIGRASGPDTGTVSPGAAATLPDPEAVARLRRLAHPAPRSTGRAHNDDADSIFRKNVPADFIKLWPVPASKHNESHQPTDPSTSLEARHCPNRHRSHRPGRCIAE
ncbi:hypothetical protein AHiyo1_49190 [Arthrobacter sp. Hiyo1]|nr:hypothetical protein AHiyo1_49190 [Arthrobacter sp. Hiyo1]